MSGLYPFGRIRQHPSHPHSSPLPRGYHALDRGRGHPDQDRRLLDQRVEPVSVQYAATFQQADDPMSRRLDDVLHILIFELRGRNEDGEVVVGFVCLDPADL